MTGSANCLIDDLSGAEDGGIEDQSEEYAPELIRWVKPPITGGGTMSTQALQYDLAVQPLPQTDNVFDAYVFGDGPRTMTPFRPLHLISIGNLKFDDLSGWAENLRWAAEQHVTFGETGWTECPQHMERIAEIRREQTWASAELVISIEDNQKEQEEEPAWVEAMVEGTLASMRRRELDQRMWIWGDIGEEYIDAQGGLQVRKRPWPRR